MQNSKIFNIWGGGTAPSPDPTPRPLVPIDRNDNFLFHTLGIRRGEDGSYLILSFWIFVGSLDKFSLRKQVQFPISDETICRQQDINLNIILTIWQGVPTVSTDQTTSKYIWLITNW